MIRNKLYKGFMYALAFIMSLAISYTIGFVVMSVITSLVLTFLMIWNIPLAEFILKEFDNVILLGSLVPCTVALISVWKRVK